MLLLQKKSYVIATQSLARRPTIGSAPYLLGLWATFDVARVHTGRQVYIMFTVFLRLS